MSNDHPGNFPEFDPYYAKWIKWCAHNRPKLRFKYSIPKEFFTHGTVAGTCYGGFDCVIFPPWHVHYKACRELHVKPAPKPVMGPPMDIKSELFDYHVPESYFKIYTALYKHSWFRKDWGGRYVECSQGLLIKLTRYSDRTIRYALSFLREKWLIRQVWRGRPDVRKPRYQHSCYELPLNMKHVRHWRIHKGKRRRKWPLYS